MGAIRTRATAIINLFDYYKGSEAEIGDMVITTEPKCNMVLKPQGVIVILEVADVEEFKVSIESRIYEKKIVTIKQGKKEPCTYHIWLWPKRTYPFSANTAFIKGHVPKEDFCLLVDNKYRPIRLLADYKAGERQILLSNISPYFEGRSYAIRGEEGIEFFCLEEEWEEVKNGYYLEKPLKRSYRKGEVLVNGTFPITSGEFWMGLSEVPKEKMKCWLYDGETCVKEFSIATGTEYKLEI